MDGIKINRYYFDATNGHPVSMREVLFNSSDDRLSDRGDGARV